VMAVGRAVLKAVSGWSFTGPACGYAARSTPATLGLEISDRLRKDPD
jgi:hypothetical protein